MRPKERIKPFFDLVDWKQLQKRWNVKFPIKLDVLIDIGKYWNLYPDQRIGQVMINLGYIPDRMDIWLDEEWEVLRDQGIAPEEFLTWTSHYDKEGNKLKEPITRLIKDLDIEHINNILNSDLLYLNEETSTIFKNELKRRNENMDNK